MVVFLITVRHPESSADYAQVERLLDMTVTSICSQSDQDFRILVVCNSVPNISITHESLLFKTVDWDPPNEKGLTRTGLSLGASSDKACKLVVGLIEAEALSPTHVFICDADDWVGADVVSHIHSKPKADAFYSDHGVFASLRDNSYKRKHGMCRYCGSTWAYTWNTIWSLGGLQELTQSTEPLPKRIIMDTVDHDFLFGILGNHSEQFNLFRGSNVKVERLPKFSVAWILETGENWSAPKRARTGRAFTRAFLDHFGVSGFFDLDEMGKTKPTTRLFESVSLIRSKVSWWLSRVTKRTQY